MNIGFPDVFGHSKAIHFRHLSVQYHQAEASETAGCRFVSLLKGPKDGRQFLFRYADAAVFDLKMQQVEAVAGPLCCNSENNFSMLGKLNRVPNQVGEYLAQPDGISNVA